MKIISDSNNFGQKCRYLRRYIHFRAPQSRISTNFYGDSRKRWCLRIPCSIFRRCRARSTKPIKLQSRRLQLHCKMEFIELWHEKKR
jgi:hypothetical protein